MSIENENQKLKRTTTTKPQENKLTMWPSNELFEQIDIHSMFDHF